MSAVAVWDMGNGGRLLHTAGLKGHHKPIRSLAFTPDSKLLLTACDDMHSNLYDVHSGGLIDSFSGEQQHFTLFVATHTCVVTAHFTHVPHAGTIHPASLTHSGVATAHTFRTVTHLCDHTHLTLV